MRAAFVLSLAWAQLAGVPHLVVAPPSSVTHIMVATLWPLLTPAQNPDVGKIKFKTDNYPPGPMGGWDIVEINQVKKEIAPVGR